MKTNAVTKFLSLLRLLNRRLLFFFTEGSVHYKSNKLMNFNSKIKAKFGNNNPEN